jgi:predicted DCC family thiol-disulfide oxidoreductase YuxK
MIFSCPDAATKRLLRQAVFLWWTLYFLFCLPYADSLWGPTAFNSILPSPRDGVVGIIVEGARLIRAYPTASTCLALMFSLSGLMSFAPLAVGLMLAGLTHAFTLAGPHIPDGGNNIASILLVYVSFFRTDRKNSLASRPWTSFLNLAMNGVSNGALLLARLQVVAVYLCAGIYKAGGDLWQNGTALYYVLQVREYSNASVLEAVRNMPALSVLGSFTVIGFQLAFPFLVWRKKARTWLFLIGILFHLGIWIAMGLPLFALIMCFTYLAFLPGRTAEQISRILWPSGKVTAAFDSQCGICMRFSRFVSKLDWAKRVVIDDARAPKLAALESIPVASRLNSMAAAIEKNNIPVSGFESIASMLARLPLFFFVRPFIALVLASGIGESLYRLIADSRTRENCRQGLCEWTQKERPA